MTAKALEGRVFELWRRFQALPLDLQTDVTRMRENLLSSEVKNEVFAVRAGSTTTPNIATASGDAVLRVIEQKVAEDKAISRSKGYAAKLADGLVQSGFLAPPKDSTALEGFPFDAKRSSFVGVDPGLADPGFTSVWSAREGAIQAGTLQRQRSGFLARLMGSTEPCYVVANDKSKAVFVFESDVALQTLDTLDVASEATVEFADELRHGVKVSTARNTETFGADSKEKQEEWLNSFINAGAQYREAFNVADTAKIQSFYELK
ncbi:hypothetical protein BBJ28_00008992, partial [Nothophytophthora sp. Chile5]